MVTHVMGILNITPDSFYDGGQLMGDRINMDAVIDRVRQLIGEGADIIDVGGESTRPDAKPVSADEEMERVIPVIREIKSRFNIEVSLDTYKADTAAEGILAGADIINDIGMLEKDPKMQDVISGKDERVTDIIAAKRIMYVLTHNRKDYTDYIDDLEKKAKYAITHGIDEDRLILDPGIGFNKTYEQNLECIGRLKELCRLGYPVLLGASNKSFIGRTLGLDVNERLEGTLATTVWGVSAGVSYVRVHDVAENVRAVRMTEAIMGLI